MTAILPRAYAISHRSSGEVKRSAAQSGTSRFFCGRVLALLLACAGSAVADQTYWTNPASGDWFDVGNWSNGLPNFAPDHFWAGWNNPTEAFIDNGGTGVVGLPGAGSDVLHIGDTQSGNLEISGGGTLRNYYSHLARSAGSTANVTVTGAGSTWNASEWVWDFLVGGEGHADITVENGGDLVSVGELGTTLAESSGSSGTVHVSGAGSMWTTAGNVIIGKGGDGEVVVDQGGRVVFSTSSTSLTLGSEVGSTGSLTITDALSSVIVYHLRVGEEGTGNLTVSNGGYLQQFSPFGGSSVGYAQGSIGTVTVTGNGSTWSNVQGTNFGHFGEGYLTISDGGVVTGGGTLGLKAGAFGLAIVDGAGSAWTGNGGNLDIGDEGEGEMHITNGGVVRSLYSAVGKSAGSEGAVTVTGPGSAWNVDFELMVGSRGTGTLTIEDGATVTNRASAIAAEPGTSAEVVVRGTGSTWTLSSSLDIANSGQGMLSILEGGVVASGSATIAGNPGSVGTVIVDGPGSRWSAQLLSVGGSNSFGGVPGGTGELTISAGGLVTSTTSTIGSKENSNGAVTVTGLGSSWQSSADLTVGRDFGGFGTLLVDQRASVSNRAAQIGTSSGSIGEVTITGSGTSWTNSSRLDVGNQGNGKLTAAAGAVVSNTIGSIGTLFNGTGEVTIRDAGSRWTNSSTLTVADRGLGTLNIENGAVVTNTVGSIGKQAGSDGEVIVDGKDSAWTNSGSLTVGDRGTGRLVVTNGAKVESAGATVAFQFGANGSIEIVGPGSTWTNSGGLIIGALGQTAELTVADGGLADVQLSGVARRAMITLNNGTLRIPDLQVTNGSILENNGTLEGDLVIDTSGLVTGSGVFDGSVNVGSGGTFSPGSSPGTVSTPFTTWSTGGTYQWEIDSTAISGGGAGANPGWDFWDTGSLTIDGNFRIAVTSLSGDDSLAPLDEWDPLHSYRWHIATADNAGFANIDSLQLDTSGFQNALDGGAFSLSASADGRDLYLHFAAVPEVPAWSMALLAGLVFLIARYGSCNRALVVRTDSK